MNIKFTINVPRPCSEKWATFDNGFCGSCNKTVIDFTKMSDSQILEFLMARQTRACGRFRPDQLKAYSSRSIIRVTPGLGLLRAGFVSFILMLSTKQTNASPPLLRPPSDSFQNMPADSVTTQTITPFHWVSGVVKDEGGDSVPGVNVMLKGTEVGTTTDQDGKFEFPQKLEEGDVLIFSFIGYDSKEYVINKGANDHIAIELEMDIAIMGDVTVDEVYTAKKGISGWWSKVKERF